MKSQAVQATGRRTASDRLDIETIRRLSHTRFIPRLFFPSSFFGQYNSVFGEQRNGVAARPLALAPALNLLTEIS